MTSVLAVCWIAAVSAGCSTGLLSGKSPHVAEAEEALGRADGAAAMKAYEHALAEDDLMDHERAEAVLAMASTERSTGNTDAVAAYVRLLGRTNLRAPDRMAIARRLEALGAELEAQGRSREAASADDVVLTKGAVRGDDRTRVARRLRTATEAWAAAEIARTSRLADTEEKVATLAAVRFEVHRAGGSKDLAARLARALEATAEGAFREVASLEAAGRFDAALAAASTIVAPLPETSALHARRRELAGRVTQHFEVLVAAARGYPGAEALRSGWMLRVTGRAHAAHREALADLDRRAKVSWRPQITGAGCPEPARSLVPSVSGGPGGAAPVVAKLEITQCSPDAQTVTTTETYTYYVTETYTETQTTYQSVSEYQGQSCTSYGGGPGRPATQTCSPRYGTRLVPQTQTVTKTRQSPRSGTRTVATTTFTYELAGSVRFVVDDKVILQPFSTSGKAVSVAKSGGPGSGVEGGTAEDAMRQALAGADEEIARGKAKVDAERARAWLERAASAESQKRDMEAEDAHVVAIRILGAASPATKAFTARLGMAEDPSVVLAAEPPPPPATSRFVVRGDGDVYAKAPPASDGADVEAPGRASGRERAFAVLSAGYASAGELVREGGARDPDHDGLGVDLALGVALASRLAVPFGPTVFDAAHGRIALGLQQGTSTDRQTAADESRHLVAGEVGYALLAGYRAPRFGIFVGGDPSWRTTRIGDLRSYGLVVPLVVRGEVRINGPAIVTASVWGLSPVGDGSVLGADLGIPLSRDGWFVVGRWDSSKLPTTLAATSSTREVARSAELRTLSFGVGRRM